MTASDNIITEDLNISTQKSKSLANQNEKAIKIANASVQELFSFTTEALIDNLFLDLVGVKETFTNKQNGKQVTVRKYYRQARDLMKWIPIAKPIPPFIIYISDLTLQVKKELEELATTAPDDLSYMLRQAAGRIFENLNL